MIDIYQEVPITVGTVMLLGAAASKEKKLKNSLILFGSGFIILGLITKQRGC